MLRSCPPTGGSPPASRGGALAIASVVGAQAPERDYVVLVASEAVDIISRVRFGPGAGPTLAKVETTTTIGINRMGPDGPHGLALSPDDRHYYVSTAHGSPFGALWKIDARTNAVVGRVELGNFPASAQVTPDGGFVYVVNFNLHGEMVPSDVSVVSTDPFVEAARIQTCTMPRIFVACNKSNDIVEIDATSWAMTRRIAAGDGVYNLATTRDGTLLLATNKRGQSVSIIDVASGKELARVPTKRRVVHDVVISPDDRYAFVSVEGVGSEPGTVEMIDLRTRQRVASADVGQMAGGINVLKTP